jgi:hypothetical protein
VRERERECKRTRAQTKGGLEERDVLAIALAPAASASVFVLCTSIASKSVPAHSEIPALAL